MISDLLTTGYGYVCSGFQGSPAINNTKKRSIAPGKNRWLCYWLV